MSVDLFVASVGRRFGARALALKAVVVSIAALGGSFASVATAEAKGPGRTYCFYKTCHRVKTIAETQALIGRDMTVVASHYDSCKKDRFNPCGLTSSGEPFFPERADNAASPVLPDGTVVLVWSKVSKEALVLRINNAGPYWGNRKLDLSRAAARKLGIGGVGEVTLRVLKAPTPAEARYSKNRRYERVPGPIGQFASLDAAHGAMSIMVAEGKANALAVADVAMVATRDAAGDVTSAFKAPLVPGFAIPKGALADALIAQSQVERRIVTAALPPSTDVNTTEGAAASISAVVPKLKAARIVAPRRMRVRAVEVKPVVADPLTVIARAVSDLIDPPKVRPAKRAAKTVRKPIQAKREAKKTIVASVKVRPKTRLTVAKRVRVDEFRAGHTTYAEERYRKPVKVAAVGKAKAKGKKIASSKAKSAASAPVPAKQAAVPKGKKAAALRKAGGWQSSAVFDVPLSRPALTGPQPRVPAGDLRDEPAVPKGPLRRVHPSALV